MSRRFTLAGLLLLVTFVGLLLAIIVPAFRYANHVKTHADLECSPKPEPCVMRV